MHRGDGGGWWYILYHFEDMIQESYDGRHGMACERSSLVWSLILTFFLLSFLLSHFLHLYLSHSWFVFLCRRECDTSDHEGNISKCIRPNKYTLLESITVLYNMVEIIKFLFSPHSVSFSMFLSHFLDVFVKLYHWFTLCLSFPFLYVRMSLSLSLFLFLSPACPFSHDLSFFRFFPEAFVTAANGCLRKIQKQIHQRKNVPWDFESKLHPTYYTSSIFSCN